MTGLSRRLTRRSEIATSPQAVHPARFSIQPQTPGIAIGISPVGPLLVIGATIEREEGRRTQRRIQARRKYGRCSNPDDNEQPFMTGARDIAEAISQPGSTGERAGQHSRQLCPDDDLEGRRVDGFRKREGKGFVGQVQRRIPGLRNMLPEATDALGRRLESRKTSFFDPTLTSTARDKTDPALREFTRLDVGLSRPQRQRGESESAHRERSTQFGKEFGALADSITRSFRYYQLPDEVRRETFAVARRYLQAVERGEQESGRSAEDIIEAASAAVNRRREKQGVKR